MIINQIPVSGHIHPNQNHCLTTMSPCFSSFTQKSAGRHNFYSTTVKMKLGAAPGAGWAVAARFTLPTQLHKINTEPFRKFQLPSLQQKKNSSYKVCGHLKLPQISVGRDGHFWSRDSIKFLSLQ